MLVGNLLFVGIEFIESFDEFVCWLLFMVVKWVFFELVVFNWVVDGIDVDFGVFVK